LSARIGITIGIVMARRQVTDEQAFDLLREQTGSL
jgi:AmiR/NasT family two-component response regulator